MGASAKSLPGLSLSCTASCPEVSEVSRQGKPADATKSPLLLFLGGRKRKTPKVRGKWNGKLENLKWSEVFAWFPHPECSANWKRSDTRSKESGFCPKTTKKVKHPKATTTTTMKNPTILRKLWFSLKKTNRTPRCFF